MQTARLAIGLLMATSVLQPALFAQDKPAARAKIGQPAPDFELRGADGKTYKLADFKDKVVVLEWISKDCPWSVRACPNLIKTADRYAEQGVVWLAVDSSKNHTAEQNAKYSQKKKLPYPILMDADGTVGRLYQARTTPHMFIIDKGTLAYAGAHDNQAPGKKPKGETRNYVAEALDALLAGKAVPVAETQSYGCTVKYAARKP